VPAGPALRLLCGGALLAAAVFTLLRAAG